MGAEVKPFRGWRVVLAVLIGLALPFPGPHVDRYLPLAAVLWKGIGEAPASFFLIAGGILSVYGAVAYALIALVTFLLRKRSSRQPS